MYDYKDRFPLSISGYLYIAVLIGLFVWRGPIVLNVLAAGAALPIPDLLGAGFAVIGLSGLYLVQPNTARVLVFLGQYAGTDQQGGLRWTLPVVMTRESVSLRLRNFENSKSKVNDLHGNPIEIAGVTVWRITGPAASVLGVDNVTRYVEVQAEAALRTLASAHPYSAPEGTLSLQGDPQAMAEALQASLQDRVSSAGVEVVEARISHMAYAPEIAAAMLQRQQASALLEAREIIVEGAVGLVEQALNALRDRNVVELDSTQKATLVSNLLIVLAGDQPLQPTLETGRGA